MAGLNRWRDEAPAVNGLALPPPIHYIKVRRGARLMKMIRVSDEVWQAIAARGKFGETEDDVLRRVFGLGEAQVKVAAGRRGRGNRRFATKRMSQTVNNGRLIVEFDDGPRKEWPLPPPSDKDGIRHVREAAVRWAIDNGATDPGQTNAVKKALTSAGYYLTR